MTDFIHPKQIIENALFANQIKARVTRKYINTKILIEEIK